MKSFITSLVLFFFVTFFSISFPAVAAGEVPQPGTLVASVSIQNASIVSQHGNTVDVAFTIQNGEGVQNGVKYGVQLISSTGKANPVIVDEKVFDETLTLAANSTLQRTLSYTAPSTLSGTYQLILTSKNEKNFPFAFRSVGEVTFTASAKGIMIEPGSCTVKLGGDQKSHPSSDTIILDRAERTLTLTCTAINTAPAAVSAVPKVLTKEFGAYGAAVETAPTATPSINFSAGEKKSVSILIPTVSNPKTYTADISFVTGDISSNIVSVRYMLQGPIASIVNLSLDRDSYQKGDTAVLSLVWNSPLPQVFLSATLTRAGGAKCANPLEQELAKDTTLVSFPITAACRNPHVSVTLKDSEGQVLDQREFSTQTESEKGPVSPIIVGIVLLALASLASLLRRHRKALANTASAGPMRVLLPIIAVVGLMSLLPFRSVDAATYVSGGGNIITVVDVNPTTYVPNADINVSWYIENQSATQSFPVTFRAVNDIGLGANNPSHVFLPSTVFGPGQMTGWGVPIIDTLTFDAPGVGGTYKVNFETGVLEPVYIKVTEQGVSEWTTQVAGCYGSTISLRHRTVSSVLVEFFADASATVPLDVTGMGFRLAYYEGPGFIKMMQNPANFYEPTIVTPILSGTSYTLSPGLQYNEIPGNSTPGPIGAGCPNTALPNYDGGYAIWYPSYVYPSTWPSQITVPYSGYIAAPQNPLIWATPSTGYVGDQIELHWWGDGATSCTGNGFSTSGAPNGTQTVTLSAPTATYAISCSNVSGTASASVFVGPPAPAITFSANPTSVTDGNPSTLTWSATDATSCTSNDFSTGGDTSGSATVYPLVFQGGSGVKTYSISCTGLGGTTTQSVDVHTCSENGSGGGASVCF